MTSIGNYAFQNCSSLTFLNIPNSVTSIGNYAFIGCTRLTSVTIPNSVTSIRGGAFSGCSSLTSVTIPNSVTSIGEEAFKSCSSLTSVIIGNSVTSISRRTFSGCSSLTSVTIGNSVANLNERAFQGCPIINVVAKNPKTLFLSQNEVFSEPTLYHAMLYVPYGTMWEAIYEGDWWKFINIREMTFETGELTHNQAYTLMNSKSFGYAVYDEVNNKVRTTKSFFEIDESSPNSSWQLVNVKGSDCLYNIGAKKYALINQNGQIELSTIPVPLSLKDADAGIVVGSDENEQWNFVLNNKVSIDHHVSGINTMTDNTSVVDKRHFTLSGQQVSEPRKGVNIVKKGNQVVKFMVK